MLTLALALKSQKWGLYLELLWYRDDHLSAAVLGQFALLAVLHQLLAVEAGHLGQAVLLLHHLDPLNPGHVDHPHESSGDLHHPDPLPGEGGDPGWLEAGGKAVAEQGEPKGRIHALGGAAHWHGGAQGVLDTVPQPPQHGDHLSVSSAHDIPGQQSMMLSLPVSEAVSAGLPAMCQHVQRAGDVAGVAELCPGPALHVAILTLLSLKLQELAKHASENWDHCHKGEEHCDSESVRTGYDR